MPFLDNSIAERNRNSIMNLDLLIERLFTRRMDYEKQGNATDSRTNTSG